MHSSVEPIDAVAVSSFTNTTPPPPDKKPTKANGTGKKTSSDYNLGTADASVHDLQQQKGIDDLPPELLRRLLMEMALTITVNRDVDYDLTLAGLGLVCRRWLDVIRSSGFREQYIQSLLAADPSHFYRLKEDYLPNAVFKLSTGFPSIPATAEDAYRNNKPVRTICLVDGELFVNFADRDRQRVFVYKTCDFTAALDRINAHRQSFAYTRSRFTTDNVVTDNDEIEGEMLPTRVLSFNVDLPDTVYILFLQGYKGASTAAHLYLMLLNITENYGRMHHAIRKVNARTGQLITTWNVDIGDDIAADDPRRSYMFRSSIHVDQQSGGVIFSGAGRSTNSLFVVYSATGQIIARYEMAKDDVELAYPSVFSLPADVGRRLASNTLSGDQNDSPDDPQQPPQASAAAATTMASTHYLWVLTRWKQCWTEVVSCLKLYRHVPNQAFRPTNSLVEKSDPRGKESTWLMADMDARGLVVVLEEMRLSALHRIHVFGPDMKYRREIGTFGATGYSFGVPMCMDHSNGVLYCHGDYLNNGLRCVDMRRRPSTSSTPQ